MAGHSKRERISLEEQRAKLNILSFENFVKYFDVTLLYRIVKTKTPEHLSKFVSQSNREARSQNLGALTVNVLAKTEKLSKSYLYRAVRTFNQLPRSIKIKTPNLKCKIFNERVREYYRTLPC